MTRKLQNMQLQVSLGLFIVISHGSRYPSSLIKGAFKIAVLLASQPAKIE